MKKKCNKHNTICQLTIIINKLNNTVYKLKFVKFLFYSIINFINLIRFDNLIG